MFKRLSISLLLMGLAAFGLGAAAFAWFSTSETGNVSISSGSADIAIDVDVNCTGAVDETVNGAPFPFPWGPIVPGDSTRDCFVVHNTGNVDLDVYVQHTDIDTQSRSFVNALRFTYDNDGDPVAGICGPFPPTDNGYTENRGCFIGSVPAGGDLPFGAQVDFVDDGNQNSSQGQTLTMNAVVTGYTGP